MDPGAWIALAGVMVAVIGGYFVMYGRLDQKISERTGVIHVKIEEVKRDYVRRDDLKDDIQSLRSEIGRVEAGQVSLGQKMDGMANAMVPAMARLTEAAISMRDKN